MAKQRVITYRSATAAVTWDQDLCIHVAECGRAGKALFVAGRDPWCDPESVDDEMVRDVVSRCPTGALAVTFAGAIADEAAPAANTVTVANNGPLYVTGDLDIDAAPERAPALAVRAALCRCGRSKNKPYCDNSHLDPAFVDAGAVGDRGQDLQESGGKLVIEFKKDGPIRISGNLTINAGSGRTAWQGTMAVLCRCGESTNKPFCDGTHRKIGWSDES